MQHLFQTMLPATLSSKIVFIWFVQSKIPTVKTFSGLFHCDLYDNLIQDSAVLENLRDPYPTNYEYKIK